MGVADHDRRDESAATPPTRDDDAAAPWWRDADDEPEPDWAEGIREGRRARGDRLRGVFESFSDDADDEADLTGDPVPPRTVTGQPEPRESSE
jgi:hypothetical protein